MTFSNITTPLILGKLILGSINEIFRIITVYERYLSQFSSKCLEEQLIYL